MVEIFCELHYLQDIDCNINRSFWQEFLSHVFWSLFVFVFLFKFIHVCKQTCNIVYIPRVLASVWYTGVISLLVDREVNTLKPLTKNRCYDTAIIVIIL